MDFSYFHDHDWLIPNTNHTTDLPTSTTYEGAIWGQLCYISAFISVPFTFFVCFLFAILSCCQRSADVSPRTNTAAMLNALFNTFSFLISVPVALLCALYCGTVAADVIPFLWNSTRQFGDLLTNNGTILEFCIEISSDAAQVPWITVDCTYNSLTESPSSPRESDMLKNLCSAVDCEFLLYFALSMDACTDGDIATFCDNELFQQGLYLFFGLACGNAVLQLAVLIFACNHTSYFLEDEDSAGAHRSCVVPEPVPEPLPIQTKPYPHLLVELTERLADAPKSYNRFAAYPLAQVAIAVDLIEAVFKVAKISQANILKDNNTSSQSNSVFDGLNSVIVHKSPGESNHSPDDKHPDFVKQDGQFINASPSSSFSTTTGTVNEPVVTSSVVVIDLEKTSAIGSDSLPAKTLSQSRVNRPVLSHRLRSLEMVPEVLFGGGGDAFPKQLVRELRKVDEYTFEGRSIEEMNVIVELYKRAMVSIGKFQNLRCIRTAKIPVLDMAIFRNHSVHSNYYYQL